jgi:hypothetical protein
MSLEQYFKSFTRLRTYEGRRKWPAFTARHQFTLKILLTGPSIQGR